MEASLAQADPDEVCRRIVDALLRLALTTEDGKKSYFSARWVAINTVSKGYGQITGEQVWELLDPLVRRGVIEETPIVEDGLGIRDALHDYGGGQITGPLWAYKANLSKEGELRQFTTHRGSETLDLLLEL